MKLVSIEDQIIKATIKLLLDAGYVLSVNDGEDTTVTRSVNPGLIFAALKTTDEDYLVVHEAGVTAPLGRTWVRFIYRNHDTEVINDYTMNLDVVMDKIIAMINEYEEEHD